MSDTAPLVGREAQDFLRLIVDSANPEFMPGQHLTNDIRAQLAFSMIRNFKAKADTILALLPATGARQMRIAEAAWDVVANLPGSVRALRIALTDTGTLLPASDADRAELRNWVDPITTVADLVNNLLTLDRGLNVYGAYHIDHAITADRCRARGLSISREHVIHNRIKSGDESTPYSLVIWTEPDKRATPQENKSS